MKTPLLDGIYKMGKLGASYDFSSTQIQLPPKIASAVRAKGLEIPDVDLYTGDNRNDKSDWNGFGREDDMHVTLKYGLHTKDPEKVQELLENEPPIHASIGNITFFTQESHDVAKYDIVSKDLHRLNKIVSDNLECTDTFPDYKPHATIAYVKKGKARNLKKDNSLSGKSFTIDEVVFSGKDGKRVTIKLQGKPMEKTAMPLLDGIIKDAMLKIANTEKMKKKYGITETEKHTPGSQVHSIGFSPKNQKWYGWSHRAVYGFGIGSKVKEGDSGFVPSNKEEFMQSLKRWNGKKTKHVEVPGGVRVTSGKYTHTEDYPKPWGKGAWTAKTMDDAKQMAKDFAESVS